MLIKIPGFDCVSELKKKKKRRINMQQPMFYVSGGLIGKLGEPETRVLVSEWM